MATIRMKGDTMVYKVWVQIEEIDEEANHYENVTEPVDVGRYDNLEEAKAVMDKIIAAA